MKEPQRGLDYSSLALLTDLYELTMAYGYWKLGIMNRRAAFSLFFRRPPFRGNVAIAAGLETAIDFIRNFHFHSSDLDYLGSLRASNGTPLFETPFLHYLKTLSFQCDIDAMVEGTPVFPHEPLLVVKGPLLQAQLLESALLNILNFQTLIATKASRICHAAGEDEVIEFGLRRAQGIDGALSAARASYIGGCHSTSNVLAGKHFGIPVKGTHAHSWIMAFETEEEAFDAYAKALPHNCIYLIDTYDSMKGAEHAIQVTKRREEEGAKMLGVRLDSGDLARLSIDIRKRLDEAGFKQAKIMASNELDEKSIHDLKKQGSKIDLWGVGTHLITAKDQPALDGVYKLCAIQNKGGKWVYKIKLSEQITKTTNPGILQVRRFFSHLGQPIADMLYDMEKGPAKNFKFADLADLKRQKQMPKNTQFKDLLIPIFRKGECVYTPPPLREVRVYSLSMLKGFSASIYPLLTPKPYFIGLETSLYELKLKLMEKARAEL